ncbi:unnamed protein product [Rhizoctonia solani]|uniref:Jacalin-type lectin domain-containing protein n=1 Tax=Rhizoctonia solani TaxID=456999 RepID=A0A8H3DKF6_9AGAM|nr:unnamed protein product [Rhizoctonia solani]
MPEINPRHVTQVNDNNHNVHPPEQGQDLDILASTSLKNSQDKDALLGNIGYLCGIRVDNNDGPQSTTRRVARYVGDELPFVQEMNDFLTETVTTKTERETNYVHHGWSIDAASTISPWISSRIAARNRRNADGAEIEAALEKPTVFTKFEAIYRALHKWGDVVPLDIEMGASLVYTDLEANISKLPDTATWNEIHSLSASRTARTTRQEGTDCSYWEKGVWPHTIVSPVHWRQTRIREVVATTRLLPAELQDQISRLYAQRLSYAPVIAHGDDSCKTCDGTPHASKSVSRVIVHAVNYIRSITFLYADESSSKHEGSNTASSEHEFVLTDGEYITEVLIWKGDWIYGLQFVTNFGRCSFHFGGGWGTPTVARNKGGVLVGAASLIKSDATVLRLHDIQGIWRRDILDTVPKENDVFSEYFGSNGAGKPFNDRAIVRNSDMTISKINIQCGSLIDGIQLIYTDPVGDGSSEYQTDRHGGNRGGQIQFILEMGENITGVSGKYDDDYITQLIFATDKGRTSEVFGGGATPKKSYSFTFSSPKDTRGTRMRLQYVCGKR